VKNSPLQRGTLCHGHIQNVQLGALGRRRPNACGSCYRCGQGAVARSAGYRIAHAWGMRRGKRGAATGHRRTLAAVVATLVVAPTGLAATRVGRDLWRRGRR
jgi:hypothetical protein